MESALSASHVPLFGFHGNLCLWGNYRHDGDRQMLLISVPHHLQNTPLVVEDELTLVSSCASAGDRTNSPLFPNIYKCPLGIGDPRLPLSRDLFAPPPCLLHL